MIFEKFPVVADGGCFCDYNFSSSLGHDLRKVSGGGGWWVGVSVIIASALVLSDRN